MRVIKEKNIERQVKCRTCESVIAYKTEDIDKNLYPTIRCPICNQFIRVSRFDRKVKLKKRR